MAQPYVTGPVGIYVNTSADFPFDGSTAGSAISGGTVVLLGWGETAPVIRLPKKYQQVHSDLSGDAAYDEMLTAEEAMISVDLTVYNEIVLRQLAASPWATGTAGTAVAGDIGTLVRTEGSALCMWLTFPFASTKTAFQSTAAGDELPLGYRFPATVLDDLTIVPGTKVNKRRLALHAIRVWTSTGAGVLYDHDMTPLLNAGVPIVPPLSVKTGVLS